MNSFYNYVLACIVLLSVGTLWFWTKENNQSSESTLVVGMMSGWAPYMSVNLQGEYEGFDVDVAQEIAKRMNKKLVIKDLGSLSSLFIALQQQQVDMIFSGLDITQKRLAEMSMVPYTGQEIKHYFLAFWQQVPQGIKTLHDLQNLDQPTICVEPGASPERLLDRYSFLIKKPLASVADMMLDVQYGKSHAAFLEPHVVNQLLKKKMSIKTCRIDLPSEFQVFGAGIAFKKESQLVQPIATIIKAMRSDGTLAFLEKKWNLEGIL